MQNYLLLLLSFLSLSVATTGAFAVGLKSAHRDPGHSYLEYISPHSQVTPQQQQQRTAIGSAVKYGQSPLPNATQWPQADLSERFGHLRDFRWLHVSTRPDFLRRSSWLFPDDGCFARAALAIANLAHWGAALPNKIFVFGDLAVKTDNSPDGEVTWWYHVAPIVEVDQQKFILDPAINPRGPLPLEDWLARMNDDIHSLNVAICGSGSYTPYDTCAKVSDGTESDAVSDQLYYLDLEWDRIRELHRNPEEELGEHPPWLDGMGT